MTVQKQIEKKKNSRKNLLLDDHNIYIETYKTAPAPSRDYYGLKVTYSKICIHHWRISHGPIKIPGYQEYTHSEYLASRSAQHDILRVFGVKIAEQTLDFARCGGKRLDMLPENVMLFITKFLGFKEICRMSQTSKNLCKMLQSDQVWKPIFRTYFKNLATKEEIKMARYGGWKAWCKKVRLSFRDRQNDDIPKNTFIKSPRKSGRGSTILPLLEKRIMDCEGDAAMKNDKPQLTHPLDVKYPHGPRVKKSGTIYPITMKGNSPRGTMRMDKRCMSTSSSMYSPKKDNSSSKNSSNSNSKNSSNSNSPRKEKDKKLVKMYLNLLETKSAPIVVRQEETVQRTRSPKLPTFNRSGMPYHMPIPKALHHPKVRATPLPDIVNDSPRERAKPHEKIMLPRHKISMPLMKPSGKTQMEMSKKLPKEPPNKTVSDEPPSKTKSAKSEAQSTEKDAPADSNNANEMPDAKGAPFRKEIKTIEDLNVETLYTSPKETIKNIKINENHTIFRSNLASLPQRSLLQGLSEKWSLKREKSFLDSNSMLLLEGRLPVSASDLKCNNANLPAVAPEGKPVENFCEIRRKLDDSLKQDKDIDDFFEKYVKDTFPSRLQKSSVKTDLSKPKKDSKKTENTKAKPVDCKIAVYENPVNKKTKKTVAKTETPAKELVIREKMQIVSCPREQKSSQNVRKQIKMANGAVYALAAANNDNETLNVKRNPNQKLYMEKQNLRVQSVRPIVRNKNLVNSKSSTMLLNRQSEQKFTNLQKVTNEALERYSHKSKMESLIDFDHALKQNHPELRVKSPINIRTAKSTTFITKKRIKPTE